MRRLLKQIILAPFWILMGDMSWIGSIVSSVGSAGAAEDAEYNQNLRTVAAIQAQDRALAQQQGNFQLLQSQYAPYRQLGTQNIPELQKMLSGGYDMQASPSAQYAMTQGTKAINANLQARGLEGNAVNQLGQLARSTAASDYSNRFNQLLAETNIGSNAVAMTGSGLNSLNAGIQSGANTTGNLLQANAGNIGNIMMSNANTQAGLIGGAAGNIGSGISSLLGNYFNSNNAGNFSGMSYSPGWGGGGYTYNNPSEVGPPTSAMGATA